MPATTPVPSTPEAPKARHPMCRDGGLPVTPNLGAKPGSPKKGAKRTGRKSKKGGQPEAVQGDVALAMKVDGDLCVDSAVRVNL